MVEYEESSREFRGSREILLFSREIQGVSREFVPFSREVQGVS